MDAIHILGILVGAALLLLVVILFAACWLFGTISQQKDSHDGGGRV